LYDCLVLAAGVCFSLRFCLFSLSPVEERIPDLPVTGKQSLFESGFLPVICFKLRQAFVMICIFLLLISKAAYILQSGEFLGAL